MNQRAVAALLLVAILLSGCWMGIPLGHVSGSGRLETKKLDLGGFTRVEADGACELDIDQGDTFAVAITADDNLFDYLVVDKIGDTLSLRLRSGYGYTSFTCRARVTMPRLRSLRVSGASRATFAGLASSEPLDVELSGASRLDGQAAAGDTRIEASGASRVVLRGSGGDLSLEGSGASTLDLADYAVGDAKVTLSGASRAEVNASGRLEADLSGASRLTYSGDPTLTTTRATGASSIRPR